MSFCLVPMEVSAVSEVQKSAISSNCSSIKESLKLTQRTDAGARVYLGGKFETILSKYITPLNIKLVEKNISDPELIENQSNFAEAKAKFSSDFIKYQQDLEDLIATNCENEPEEFYEKLVLVRAGRKLMMKDVIGLKNLTARQVNLVKKLRSRI